MDPDDTVVEVQEPVSSSELSQYIDEGTESKSFSVPPHTGAKTPDLMDLREAYKDLVCAPQVTYKDIVSIHGKVEFAMVACSCPLSHIPIYSISVHT